jgi:hypothetical protein
VGANATKDESKDPEDAFLAMLQQGILPMICVGFVLYHQEAAYVQNAWRELPETGAGRRNILGVLRLALIPLRDSRDSQDDKTEMISSKETIFASAEIQTDRRSIRVISIISVICGKVLGFCAKQRHANKKGAVNPAPWCFNLLSKTQALAHAVRARHCRMWQDGFIREAECTINRA